METYYKVLNADGSCFHGGHGKWFLPKGKRPGKWMPKIEGELSPCSNGYHAVTRAQLKSWLGPAIFTAEVKGAGIHQDDKSVFPHTRLIAKLETWNDRTARLFAADCAEHVLHIFEEKYPDDKRPRLAIQAARDFANGKISKDEMAAARDAAWDAARAAAWASAWDAAWDAARAAAWASAWDAARDAAGAAARAAARDAESDWQTERLFEYLDGKAGK